MTSPRVLSAVRQHGKYLYFLCYVLRMQKMFLQESIMESTTRRKMAVSELSRDEKKRDSDEKYSLSGNSKSSKAANSTAPKGKKRQRTDDIADAIQSMSKQQIQQQTVREMKKEKSKRKWDNAQNLQKLRPISSGGAARNRPSASYSTARPKIGGHAQRQRAQASSEFAQG